jgi:hypothetical protein
MKTFTKCVTVSALCVSFAQKPLAKTFRKRFLRKIERNVYSKAYMDVVLVELKGIVSRDFSVLFLIYLDRYEVPNRAGSGLLFILKRSSYLNF